MTTIYQLLFSALLAVATFILLHVISPDAGDLSIDAAAISALWLMFAIAVMVSPCLNKSRPSTATGNKETGKVKWFNVNKGYGFITTQAGQDIFVHFRSIEGRGRKILHQGQDVEFIVTQGDKGPQAEEVQIIKV